MDAMTITPYETSRRGMIAGLAVSCIPMVCGPASEAAEKDKGTTAWPLRVRTGSSSAVPVTHWHDERIDGSNLRPALNAAVEAIRAGQVPGRYLMVPPRAGGWTVDREVVFDVSNLKVDFFGSIRQTASTVQHTLRFVSNASVVLPSFFLDNIELFFAEGVIIDGNAAAMDFSEPAPGRTPDYATLHCDHVTRLRVYGGHFTNGPMNSVSFRRCPRHRIERAEFSRSRWDNGFTASTDLADYTELDLRTWGGGAAIDCVAHDNHDVGMAAYNASGQRFVRCDSYHNDTGFSYEHAYGVVTGQKDYHGSFESCRAYNNRRWGIYIDGTGVTLDDNCETWGNTGIAGDKLNITGTGVSVASVRNAYIGGRHHHNGRCGVHLTNPTGIDMKVELAADCSDNAWHGVRVQNLGSLRVSGKARFNGNGTASTGYSGVYGHGLYCSADSTMDGKGCVIVDSGAEFSRNASRAIRVSNYSRACVRGAWGQDNFAFAGAGSSAAILLDNLTEAVVEDCHMYCTNARQLEVVNIGSGVTNGIESGTRGNASTMLVLNAARAKRHSTP